MSPARVRQQETRAKRLHLSQKRLVVVVAFVVYVMCGVSGVWCRVWCGGGMVVGWWWCVVCRAWCCVVCGVWCVVCGGGDVCIMTCACIGCDSIARAGVRYVTPSTDLQAMDQASVGK